MIKIEAAGRGSPVPLKSLWVGDTFLLDDTVCMIASRNGHSFVLNLSNGKDDSSINLSTTPLLVTLVECKLLYQIE